MLLAPATNLIPLGLWWGGEWLPLVCLLQTYSSHSHWYLPICRTIRASASLNFYIKRKYYLAHMVQLLKIDWVYFVLEISWWSASNGQRIWVAEDDTFPAFIKDVLKMLFQVLNIFTLLLFRHSHVFTRRFSEMFNFILGRDSWFVFVCSSVIAHLILDTVLGRRRCGWGCRIPWTETESNRSWANIFCWSF